MSDLRVLCFLGRGNLRVASPPDGAAGATPYYQLTHYDAPDGIEAYCAPDYLAQKLALSRITVAVTPAVRDAPPAGGLSELERLREVLRSRLPACEVEPLEIPDGRTPAELWDLFDKLVGFLREDRAPVHIDVTHGFRHMPILGVLAAQYAEALSLTKIEAMTYAALDMHVQGTNSSGHVVEWAPVLDLKPLVELLDWNVSAAVFRDTGRAGGIVEQVRELRGSLRRARHAGGSPVPPRAGNDLAGLGAVESSLEKLSDDLLALRVESLQAPKGSAAQAASRLVEPAVRDAVTDHARPLRHLLTELAGTAARFQIGGEVELIRWYASHDHVVQALSLGNEALLNLALRCLGVPEDKRLDVTTRDGLRRVLGGLSKSARRGKAGRFPPAVAQARANDRALAALADKLAEVGDVRNDAGHAEQRAESLTAAKLRKTARNLAKEIVALEALVASGLTIPVDPEPLPLFNATCHDQTALVDRLLAAGFSLVPDARGHVPEVPVDADYSAVQAAACDIVSQAEAAGAHGLLVGGLTSLGIAIAAAAERRSLGLFEAATARQRDAHDRFVFELHGVRCIAPALGGRFCAFRPQAGAALPHDGTT
jgi:CRISPR-associated DxTHG motif protein